MKKLVTNYLLVLSSALAVVGVSQANAADYSATKTAQTQQKDTRDQGVPHRSKHTQQGRRHGVMAKLDLTDAQKAQIKAIKDARRTERQTDRQSNQAEHEQHRIQMQALMSNAALDTTMLNNLANEHATQAKERFIDRTRTRHAIAQILTAEQRAQLQQLHHRRGKHGKRHTR